MADTETLAFEEAYQLLQETMQRLEDGALPLEEALALYEHGMSLTTLCAQYLEKAEMRVLQIEAALDEALGDGYTEEAGHANGHPRLWDDE